ncbi:MAG TPA: carbon monoxide dehydrogenase subunit G [Streptosporangiaceae bacterium]|nr:carbon monoxide dehydrogenase subunit G [Streptosporangiaceae bacterium]
MRISGAATMHAPAGRVWAALTDPAVLVAAIPGCEQFEPAGPDTYRFTVAAAVASIQASYTGEVSLSQQQQPSSFVLTASGAGAPGTVTTSVQIRLADIANGTTELSYDADAVIGGLIAGVGQRMLSSVARRLAGAFFSSVDEFLVGTGRAGPIRAVPTVPVFTGPDSSGPAVTGPGPDSSAQIPTAPVSTGPVSTGSVSTVPGPGSVEPHAGSSPARERRGGSARFPLDSGFARGMLAGAAVTLAGVAAAGLIRRCLLTGRGTR